MRAARRHAGDHQARDRDRARRAPASSSCSRRCSPRARSSCSSGRRARCSTTSGAGDVVAFTGGSATARTLRAHASSSSTRCASTSRPTASTPRCSAPTSSSSSETGALFLADVVRDMTQKTGQKCTAIRRVLVPEAAHGRGRATRCASGSAALAIGDPSREDVRMGPLATAQQHADVRGRHRAPRRRDRRRSTAAPARSRRSACRPARASSSGPSCARPTTPMTCAPLNDHEVFGPVIDGRHATTATADVRGGVRRARRRLPGQLRVLRRSRLGRERSSAPRRRGPAGSTSARRRWPRSRPGPGTVLPSLVHGGPGRAGGGEELGGERGLHFYMQRTALEGDASVLKSLLG